MSKLYLDPDQLRGLVLQAQLGVFKIELVQAVRLLVREMGGNEDDEQDTLLEVVKSYQRINTDANVFAYITSLAHSSICGRIRKEKMFLKHVRFYALLNSKS